MGSKQLKITDSGLSDRISDLPSNIIECILERTPIFDAVATSILSKEWRHKWRRIGNLVFDKEFVDYVIIRDQPALKNLEYCNIISNILLLHLGPIRKFVIYIPNFGNNSPSDFLSPWMLFVSQNEVKELTIEAHHARIRLPSYIFLCKELPNLKISVHTLDVHPPQDFNGFCNLLSLDLFGLLDGDEMSFLVSKCPMLERLSLNGITRGNPLVVDAYSLHLLYIYYSIQEVLTLKNVDRVTAISLRFSSQGYMVFSDLINIFTAVPNVETVTLRPLHTIIDIPEEAPVNFPITLHNHKSLTVIDIALHSQQCIYFILCIFKSSPTLQELNLGILPSSSNEDEAALHFLDVQLMESNKLSLSSLLTVKMKGLLGSKVEIKFINLILSCTPTLEKMFLTGKSILIEAEVMLLSEILQCPRPSRQAQVIYSKFPKDSSIFNF